MPELKSDYERETNYELLYLNATWIVWKICLSKQSTDKAIVR